jgi:ketosteroid isomerase-like protein
MRSLSNPSRHLPLFFLRHLTLFVLALLVPRTGLAQSPTDVNAAREVRETLIAMWDAIESGDLDRYVSYIHPDFMAFGESDVYLARGKELELRGIADYLQRARAVHTEMHQPEVTIRGDVAWIVYYWTDSGWVDGERMTSRGKSTRIFVREGDRWLCIHGHYTSVP